MRTKALLTSALLIIIFTASATVADSGPLDRFLQDHRERHGRDISIVSKNRSLDLPAIGYNTAKLSLGEIIGVSDNLTPAHFDQSNPDAAKLTDGRIILVWEDRRTGNSTIFAQIIGTDGEPEGSNFPVAGMDSYVDLNDPKAVSDGTGGYYIVWREISTGLLKASRYDSDSILLYGPFPVNSDNGNYAGPFDIAAFPGGPLVAVWEDYGLTSNIAVRIISLTGTPLIDPVFINDNASPTDLWYPAVAIDTTASVIAVAWEDYRNGNADIYYQFVNADGSLSGSNQSPVAAAALGEDQLLPAVTFNNNDQFILGWLDTRDGNSRLYYQRFGRTSGLIGTNNPVSTDSAEVFAYTSRVVSREGHFAFNWSSYSGSDISVLAQLYSSGSPTGSIIDIINSETSVPPEIGAAYDNGGILNSLWEVSVTGLNDLELQQFSTDGAPLRLESLTVNDDASGAASFDASLAVVNDTLAVAVFVDQRNDIGDIYFEKVPFSGSVVPENQKLNSDDLTSILQESPDISVNDTNWDAVWVDYRAFEGLTGPRIISNSAEINSDIIPSPFLISPQGDITPKRDPGIIRFNDGLRLSTWIENDGISDKLRGLFFTEDSLPSESVDIQDFSEITETVIENSSLSRDINDIVTLSYFSRTHPDGPSARAIRFNSDGTELSRYGFTSDIGGIVIDAIDAAVGPTGILSLLWLGSDANLYLTSLDINGAVLNGSIQVNSDPLAFPEQIRVAVSPNGLTAAGWIDYRTGKPNMMYRVFDSDLNPVMVELSASTGNPRFMQDPALAAGTSQLWLGWSDPSSNGLGVYARAVDYIPTDVDDENGNLPVTFTLMQNYPNPFNPSTNIGFGLTSRAEIELSIYDILGRKVTTLAEGEFPAGNHTVTWKAVNNDSEKIASGVYFYMLKTEERTETRKMILLK